MKNIERSLDLREILSFFQFFCLGFFTHPATVMGATCMEACDRNYIFLNNHRAGEDYETNCHLRKTD